MRYAVQGKSSVMPVIKRLQDHPYKWKVEPAPLKQIANVEKTLPKSFITKDGFGITERGKKYFRPLIAGENQSMKHNKFYQQPKSVLVKKKLPPWR